MTGSESTTSASKGAGPLLEVEDLDVTYGFGRRAFRAVEGVSFTVAKGETVGVVGESGSGKSTVGRAILGLARPTNGTIRFDGEDITHISRKQRQRIASRLQVVFQDPRSSLNEAKKIGDILTEPLIANRAMSKKASIERARELLVRVGLPEDSMDRQPDMFSGGQRQRIAIARALMVSPDLVICDEPVTALDISVQAQIINLFREIQRETGVSYLFVAHDLSVVRLVSERVLVMSAGKVVEQGPTEEVYANPTEAYTRRLLAAEPYPDPVIQRERRKAWDALTVPA